MTEWHTIFDYTPLLKKIIENLPTNITNTKFCISDHDDIQMYITYLILAESNSDIFIVRNQENIDQLKNSRKQVGDLVWDVIVLDEQAKKYQILKDNICRVFYTEKLTGILINKNYTETLQKKLLTKLHINKDITFSQAISDIQMSDIWLCTSHTLLRTCKIVLCMIATGPYKNFINDLIINIHNYFLRQYNITIMLFTDDPDKFPDKYERITIRKKYIKWTGFPGDTLYRYHYFLTEKDFLLSHDYIFYMDADTKFYSTFPDKNLLIEKKGLVAVEHMHMVMGNKKGNLLGSPDTNPKSTACIDQEEKMTGYYTGAFQGGTAQEYISACETMRKNINIDDENNIIAKWHDESHWNRYLLNNPPEKVLDSGYCFPEPILTGSSHWSEKYGEKGISPVIISVHKNNTEYHVN